MKCWTLVVLSLLAAPLLADFAAGLRAYDSHDYVTAAQEWRPAAESGDPAAEFNFGLLYLNGQGVPQDYAEALHWFFESANQGYAKAEYNLGVMYAVGTGTRRDYLKAHLWFNLCAATGSTRCADQRALVEKKMKRPAIEQAQRLATQWRPKPASNIPH